ncbi:hypothetical protein EDB83DRAFT_2243006, partial [Lactarius deliciosus]
WVSCFPPTRTTRFPIAELSRPDPILLYARDELHDNGVSHLLVRVVRHSS